MLYRQQMMALPDAYTHAAEVMACNIMDARRWKGSMRFWRSGCRAGMPEPTDARAQRRHLPDVYDAHAKFYPD
jgi:hypothetical protein